jgi:hypothetical protein
MIYSQQVKELINERGNKPMSMNFSTAEELDQQKSKISQERIRKLTQDRQTPHGNGKLAQTDGLKPIKTKGNRRNQHIVIDDVEFDPRRIRSLRDLETDDEGIE